MLYPNDHPGDVLITIGLSAALFGRRYSDGRPDTYRFAPARELPPNPLSKETQARIEHETITKAADRQARRLERKQADRERNSRPSPHPKCQKLER